MNRPLIITGQGDHRRQDDKHDIAFWRYLAIVGAVLLALALAFESSTVNQRGVSTRVTESRAAAETPGRAPAAALPFPTRPDWPGGAQGASGRSGSRH